MTGLKEYFIQIANYPLLSQEEEQELGRRIKAGDKHARDRLIQSNLKLVVAIAKNYKSTKLPFEDIVADGNLGLVAAVDKYDPDLGYRFSTCAVPWIKQAILKGLAEKSRTVRLPAHVWQQLSQLKKLENELGADGHAVSDAELAAAMQVETERIGALRTWRQAELSLETPLGDDSDDTIADLQADTDKNPMEQMDDVDDHDRIMRKLDALPDRTRQIMLMRYGFNDKHYCYTLDEIGEQLGITRERVRQIEKQTLNDLRNSWDRQAGQTDSPRREKIMEDIRVFESTKQEVEKLAHITDVLNAVTWSVISDINIDLSIIQMGTDNIVHGYKPCTLSRDTFVTLKNLYLAAHDLRLHLDELDMRLEQIAKDTNSDFRDKQIVSFFAFRLVDPSAFRLVIRLIIPQAAAVCQD